MLKICLKKDMISKFQNLDTNLQKTRKDLKISNIENINQDFLKLNLERLQGINLFICVDITLQFLETIQKNSVLKILKIF